MFHHAGGFGFFPFGMFSALFTVLLLIAVFVLFMAWLVRALSGPPTSRAAGPVGPPPPQPGTPLDILARRFAAGEISAEDYRSMRDVLQEPPKT